MQQKYTSCAPDIGATLKPYTRYSDLIRSSGILHVSLLANVLTHMAPRAHFLQSIVHDVTKEKLTDQKHSYGVACIVGHI